MSCLQSTQPSSRALRPFTNNLRENSISSAIGTNAEKSSFDILIQTFRFRELLLGTHLYCPENVNGKFKPNPSIYLHAAKALGAKPSECVVFEDSLTGLLAAKAAGMKCVIINHGQHLKHLSMADYQIHDYSQVQEALAKLSS